MSLDYNTDWTIVGRENKFIFLVSDSVKSNHCPFHSKERWLDNSVEISAISDSQCLFLLLTNMLFSKCWVSYSNHEFRNLVNNSRIIDLEVHFKKKLSQNSTYLLASIKSPLWLMEHEGILGTLDSCQLRANALLSSKSLGISPSAMPSHPDRWL